MCPPSSTGMGRKLTTARLMLIAARNMMSSKMSRLANPYDQAAMLIALRLLAERIETLSRQQRLIDTEILARARRVAPALLAERGIGPIGAAQLLVNPFITSTTAWYLFDVSMPVRGLVWQLRQSPQPRHLQGSPWDVVALACSRPPAGERRGAPQSLV